MEGEPVHVDLAKVGASNSVPVGLCVLDGGNGQVLGVSADGPSSLGDPDVLVADGGLHLREGIVEQTRSRVDGVRHGVLEVWVGVHAGPVNGIRDGRVGGVGPRSPGVNVTDGGLAQGSGSKGSPDLLDVVDEVVWVGTRAGLGLDTGRRDAVQVLAAHGDAHDQVGELGAVLRDGRVDSRELSLDVTIASRGPDAEEKGRVLRNGCGNGGDGLVGGAAALLRRLSVGGSSGKSKT